LDKPNDAAKWFFQPVYNGLGCGSPALAAPVKEAIQGFYETVR
jgi:hypothetical protein